MKLTVLHDYKSSGNLENPIRLVVGDTVKTGETTDPYGEYPDWVYCTCERTGVSGWVAAGVLEGGVGMATVTRDYTSREMTVRAGDVVEAEYELNGWYWCVRETDDDAGWVAKNNLKVSV